MNASGTGEGNPAAKAEEPALSGEAQQSVGGNRKILVVDDNAVVLKTLAGKLSAVGFKVITEAESAAGVGAARKECPDLIILDINFPPDNGFSSLQWDGLNILQWVKRFEELKDIPVIIITADDPAKHKEQTLAAGATAFFRKPVDHEQLVATIVQILGAAPQ
jgi:CheY-like chemotaxis protein